MFCGSRENLHTYEAVVNPWVGQRIASRRHRLHHNTAWMLKSITESNIDSPTTVMRKARAFCSAFGQCALMAAGMTGVSPKVVDRCFEGWYGRGTAHISETRHVGSSKSHSNADFIETMQTWRDCESHGLGP